MTYYRDRAFCSAICGSTWCDRNFTPEQEIKADKWWGNGPAPVAFYPLHITCVEYRAPQGHKHPEGVDSRPTHAKVRSKVFGNADPKFGGDEKTGNGATR